MDESNRRDFGELYDKLARCFQVSASKDQKHDVFEACLEIDFPSVRSAILGMVANRTRKEGMPAPGDIRAESFRSAAQMALKRASGSQTSRMSDGDIQAIVAQLKRATANPRPPEGQSGRESAWLFHEMLHSSDESIPNHLLPKFPPVTVRQAQVITDLGGVAAFRSLTAETVLDAREIFCRKMAQS